MADSSSKLLKHCQRSYQALWDVAEARPGAIDC